MRKFVGIFLTVAALIAMLQAAHAQASFIFGMIVGSSMSSEGKTTTHGPGTADIMYVAPRIGERITDPLGVRTMASPCYSHSYLKERGSFTSSDKYGRHSPSLRDYFAQTVETPAQYEVLQAIRTTATTDTGCVRIIFAYIEKEKVTPLESLKALPAQ